MLTLAAADTLAGVAQTASKVTCTILGMELAAGAEAYKCLDQRQLAVAAAAVCMTSFPGGVPSLI